MTVLLQPDYSDAKKMLQGAHSEFWVNLREWVRLLEPEASHVFRCPVQQDLHFPRVLFPPSDHLDSSKHAVEASCLIQYVFECACVCLGCSWF